MESHGEEYFEVIHVEFSDNLTPAHKQIYLKYMQLNPDLIHNAELYPQLLKVLTIELNKLGDHSTTNEWKDLMNRWVSFVKEKCMEVKQCQTNYSLPVEDFELLNMVDHDKQQLEPTSIELSCILDHLEITDNPSRAWLTIEVELEARGSPTSKEESWKTRFEKWCNKVKRKKEILDSIPLKNSDKMNFLTRLELRVLDYIRFEVPKRELICRVCLETRGENLTDIFDSSASEFMISKKICECANVKMTSDDGLPQHICGNCLTLLEKAYKFKVLCENSDNQLRNQSNKPKEEYVTYILNDSDITDTQNLDYLDDDDVEDTQEDTTEMDVLYEEEEKNVDSEKTAEGKEAESTEEDIDQEIKPVNDSDVTINQCEICGIICYNKLSLNKHMHSHTIERPHRCTLCKKEFKTKLTLRVHMRSHTGERPYICEVCGKTFTQDCTLSYHRSIHTGKKNYLCSVCDYRARNLNDLKIHTRTHTGSRPYHCNQCPSKFTTSSNLHKHLRRHTGVKNFQTCGKAFKTWSAVTNHRAIHSDVKMFECQHCPYRGSTKANLQIHNRTHTGIQPYVCDQCPLKFSTASNRNKHTRNVHEKLKLHECGSCGRSFFSRESARKHMVIHTGLKPYTCTKCPMAYGWYNGLQKHMKTQHPGIKMPTEKHFLDIIGN